MKNLLFPLSGDSVRRLPPVAIVIAVVLVFAWACGDDDDEAQNPPDPTSTPQVDEDRNRFGGTYGWLNGEEKGKRLSYVEDVGPGSVVRILDDVLLEGSLAKFDVTAGFAIYTYVILVNSDSILVAVWSSGVGELQMPLGDDCLDSQQVTLRGVKGSMIDVFLLAAYPKDLPRWRAPARPASTCWLKFADGTPVALEDLRSKHLLLAQGSNSTQGGLGNAGIVTEVQYAGTIIVDLQNCTYGISNDSGTFKPEAGLSIDSVEHLLAVAKLFEQTLKKAPTYVWDSKRGSTERYDGDSSSAELEGCPRPNGDAP